MSSPNDDNQPQYVFSLNEIDVLCGRGSGPNDRVGNIEFRNLILSRKAEYLAATTRDAKGRIAAEIVDNVRSRGGRFLKKLSPAQAKDAGFKRGITVYELADEPTVLEKAKQTLRQNRAEFVAGVTKAQQMIMGGGKGDGGVGDSGNSGSNCGEGNGVFNGIGGGGHASPAMMGGASNFGVDREAPTPVMQGGSQRNNMNNMDGMNSMDGMNNMGNYPFPPNNNAMNMQCHSVNSSNSSGGMSMNPIPLDAPTSLDSNQRPKFSARTAAELNAALFASSVLNSMGGGVGNSKGPVENRSRSNTSQFSTNSGSQGLQTIISGSGSSGSGSRSGDGNSFLSSEQGNISVQMAEALYAAMGGSSSISDVSSKMSTNSAEVFETLLRECNSVGQQQQLMQNMKFQQGMPFDQLNSPQQSVQSQMTTSNTSLPKTMEYIYENQQAQFQQYNQREFQQSGPYPNDVPSDSVFGSLVRQYDSKGQNVQGQQYEQFNPQNPRANDFPVSEQEGFHAQKLNDSYSNAFGSIADDQQKLLEQYEQLQSQQFNDESPVPPLIGSGSNPGNKGDDEAKKLLQQYEQSQGPQNVPQSNEYQSNLGTTNSGSNAGTLHQDRQAQTVSDTTVPIKDKPSELRPGGRRSSKARNFQFESHQNTLQKSTKNNSSIKLNVEPAKYDMEESLRLSFVTANQLAATLGDDNNMSTSSIRQAGKSSSTFSPALKRNQMYKITKRQSYNDMSGDISLMSIDMSLSEISQELHRGPGNATKTKPKEDSIAEKDEKEVTKDESAAETRPKEVILEKTENNEMARFGESSMSLGNALEEGWMDSLSSSSKLKYDDSCDISDIRKTS